MGSIISYYSKSSSAQLLEDYMNTYNSFSYSQYKNLYYYDYNFTDVVSADNNVTKDPDFINNPNYYKLYIYVHNSDNNEENVALKKLYEDYSMKHNTNVDKYLVSYGANLLNEKEIEENKFVDCYDSGFDLFCPEDINCSKCTSNYMLDHKISCAMTYKGKFVGYYLYMRSSTPVKTPLRLANNVGIIDSGYRGNIKAYFDINSCAEFNFVKANRYMQICPPDIGKPMKVIVVDSISVLGENNARNKGGYGSTGD